MQRVSIPPARSWWPLVEMAIEEDVGPGDATTPLVVEASRQGDAVVESRQALVVCGLEIAAAVFGCLDPAADFEPTVSDGDHLQPGQPMAHVIGNLRAILAAERTALNFLGRLCGIATQARRYVDAVAGLRARIVDTRKTLPGWRALDKYATAVGGAVNHRVGLFDGVLLKDNHIALAGGVEAAVKAAIAEAPANLRIQIEVESEADAIKAVDAGADFLLLDNRTPEEIESIVTRVGSRALLEASGGINLDNVRRYAETGVHRISIGALTHSAPGADVALEILQSGGENTSVGATR
ncbi:MAG: carboxylating nicotinate-nucleotide diphosphorylase [Myxococcales bacterium]|nr:carboxylating nicotinate-nucleotide diphosphorylase [Myxococcales bacterium]